MLRPRVIPSLLIKNKGLVKTTNFKDPKYVGDPINAVRIFNEKEVDEIMISDIDATVKNLEPDFNLIKNLAAECRMPLCYSGGIKTAEHAQKIFALGVEKIAISSAAVSNPALITEIANTVGNQSLVIVIDAKKNKKTGIFEVFTHNGLKATGLSVKEFSLEVQHRGAGELVINSIDNDGEMKGYNYDLIEVVRDQIYLPLTILGGAGTLSDIKELINRYRIIGASAGSLFVFKGIFKAVLINYPNRIEKEKITLD